MSGPLEDATHDEASQAFDRVMAAKDDRVASVRRLLADNGVELDSSDDGLQRVNDWFRSAVEGDPEAETLEPRWYGVVNDLALFLGDVMIERSPGLAWTFYDGDPKNASFQRHVIMGFTQPANPDYNVDVDYLLAGYGIQALEGQADPEAFGTGSPRPRRRPDGRAEEPGMTLGDDTAALDIGPVGDDDPGGWSP